MAMSCVTGGKECVGCQECYDRSFDRYCGEDYEAEWSEKIKEDMFEVLDGAKLGIMDIYGLDEQGVKMIIEEYLEK